MQLSEECFTYKAKMQLGPDSALVRTAGGASPPVLGVLSHQQLLSHQRPVAGRAVTRPN